MLNVVPGGQLSDTCVFQDPPQTFTNWQGTIMNPPQWLKDVKVLDASTILFTDDNTNIHTRNYHILVNVAYTSGGNTTLTTSPDPTIINVGTDGGATVIGSDHLLLSQAQPQPAAAEV
jgi:hypothetical protein